MNEIEQRMAAILDGIPVRFSPQHEVGRKVFKARCKSHLPCQYQDPVNYVDDDEIHICDLDTQIECRWRIAAVSYPQFKLDFAIFREPFKIDVEVDGWWFHRATEEQVRSDKRRDIALQAMGWQIVRFRADEVHNKPTSVQKRVRAILVECQPKPERLL